MAEGEREMIKVSVAKLRKGDHIRFAPDKGLTYVLERHPQVNTADHALMVVNYGDRGAMMVSLETPVYALQMIRTVTAPCLVHGGDVELLHDMALGPAPRGVLCGDCNEKATAQVMQWMAEKNAPRPEPRVGDTVYINGGVTQIDRFSEESGTQLRSGRWVCANDFTWITDSVWAYRKAEEK